MKAIWDLDYDMYEDMTYKCPSCPECRAPIGMFEDGNYHCFSCGEIVEVDDPYMKKWLESRQEKKIEIEDCFPESVVNVKGEKIKMGCGGKGTAEVHYVRNPITMKWQAAGGVCKKCGMSWIV